MIRQAFYDTGRWPRPMEHKLPRWRAVEAAMVDNFEEPKSPQASAEDDDQGVPADMINQVEIKPFAERLRMIIALSLICWALLLAVLALVLG